MARKSVIYIISCTKCGKEIQYQCVESQLKEPMQMPKHIDIRDSKGVTPCLGSLGPANIQIRK